MCCNEAACKTWFYTTIYQIMAGFPWAIAFWTMSSKVDADQCSGIPLLFVTVAKIVFTVTTALSIVAIHVQYRIENKSLKSHKKKCYQPTLFFLFTAIFVCWFAMWVFSWVAVAFRDDCVDNTMKLIWGAAIFPLTLIGIGLCLGCIGIVAVIIAAVNSYLIYFPNCTVI